MRQEVSAVKHKKVKAFLEALKTDPKAQELIRDIPEPETTSSRIRAYAKIAKDLGYDLSDADLDAFILDQELYLQAKAEAAAKEIKELPEDELEEVAGGGDHPECKNTYKDRENCWVHDGCDIVNTHYPNYQCHYNSKCNSMQGSLCGEKEYDKCGNSYACGGYYY